MLNVKKAGRTGRIWANWGIKKKKNSNYRKGGGEVAKGTSSLKNPILREGRKTRSPKYGQKKTRKEKAKGEKGSFSGQMRGKKSLQERRRESPLRKNEESANCVGLGC